MPTALLEVNGAGPSTSAASTANGHLDAGTSTTSFLSVGFTVVEGANLEGKDFVQQVRLLVSRFSAVELITRRSSRHCSGCWTENDMSSRARKICSTLNQRSLQYSALVDEVLIATQEAMRGKIEQLLSDANRKITSLTKRIEELKEQSGE